MKQGLDLLERSSRGGLQVLLVQGEPGIGKSRLIDELLLAAREAEFSVFRGAADEIERRRPFRVFLDALDVERDSDDTARAEIARLLAQSDWRLSRRRWVRESHPLPWAPSPASNRLCANQNPQRAARSGSPRSRKP